VEPAVRLEPAGRPTRVPDAVASPFRGGLPVLCLNTADASVVAAVQLAARAPDLAALLLVRKLAVADGALGEKLDQRLTEHVLSRASAPSDAA
ncbi:MAG TPA: hypothetical protein VND93_07285, partial [Myxococcales bacterium]|nr:hypothetical protein [Myxococcales bacterium]